MNSLLRKDLLWRNLFWKVSCEFVGATIPLDCVQRPRVNVILTRQVDVFTSTHVARSVQEDVLQAVGPCNEIKEQNFNGDCSDFKQEGNNCTQKTSSKTRIFSGLLLQRRPNQNNRYLRRMRPHSSRRERVVIIFSWDKEKETCSQVAEGWLA